MHFIRGWESHFAGWFSSRLFSLLALPALLCGCGGQGESIRIDGSSTVYPVSEAAAEAYRVEHPEIRISVSQSGTSAGFSKFVKGETDISDASRPIKDSEVEEARANGIEVVGFVVAQDGLAVVANPENDWCDSLTVEQLKTIWRPEAKGTVSTWQDVNPDWPDVPLKLYGPGTASGTFEYFTQVINGEKKASRPDYTPSENDNMLVRGVSNEKGGLGYFGYAYYAENKEKLKLLGVDAGEGDGPVKPDEASVKDGSYKPLARPIFIYVSKKSLARPAVSEFVNFYVENAEKFAVQKLYVSPSQDELASNAELLKSEATAHLEPTAAN
ncbi:PstS family phosphate ABC transporter substrate-binding protein [Adhaeretor mobilis]|uniref:Phosphate-binding protein n=1 Tax=Adhaeretor mobilis TaxID=1930276 RepID=A0A517MZX6_9BACT|nr:PstS family phosphate ABC transporter substrate-binding protein [Adhaeretor mobilis]QDT00439.1 Phosphate-binding protein PstS precursor [Adhaeretor mobilis]